MLVVATVSSLAEALAIADWRRRIGTLYQELREDGDPQRAWQRWRDTRDDLWRTHPASPLPAARRRAFSGLRYFPYDPALRVDAVLEAGSRVAASLPTSAPLGTAFVAVAEASFRLDGPRRLTVFWLDDYAGGVLIAFRDHTSGGETYTAGRYLVDTAKGADPGIGERCVLDFNFAYNPSCSYDPVYACPLAPRANWLDVAVRAGELDPAAEQIGPPR
jgi:uncharacterized protein